ncbi:MAG: peptidyl-prolyl cis-trans isomerase [Nitrospirae bacterium]|nr:peptidyl-prolyl cis-trans isomerase [Nitrospirota bacterium]
MAMKKLLLVVYCLMFTLLLGCASMKTGDDLVLAIVDGEPMTEEDLKYVLTISHRREDLSSAGSIDLKNYIQKLIDDELIIQEARKSGMDKLPEIKQAIDAYILRESVVRLHDEEIVRKVSVTEEEIKEYYKCNYERFTIGYIETDSEEKAKEALGQLKNNVDFKQIAVAYSLHSSQEKGGEIILLKGTLNPLLKNVIVNLKPGEISDVINNKDKYYIVKLIERKAAPEDEFKKLQKSIEKEIRKKKEKELSDKYLQYLREKMKVKINRELLAEIKEITEKEEKDSSLIDKEVLVEINGEKVLSVEEFMKLIKSSRIKSTDDLLNSWIERKLIDIEALSRHYEKGKDLQRMIHRYENQLLKKTFTERVIKPQITITEVDLEEYYQNNQTEFLSPAKYRIQQITVKTIEEATEVEKNLRNGADFSWIAKRKSIDSESSKGGEAGWFTKRELSEPLRNIVENLNTGELSPVIQANSQYKIIKILEKQEEAIEEFEKVKNDVSKAVYDKKFKEIVEKYVNQLKKDAEILVYEDVIKSLEVKLQR